MIEAGRKTLKNLIFSHLLKIELVSRNFFHFLKNQIMRVLFGSIKKTKLGRNCEFGCHSVADFLNPIQIFSNQIDKWLILDKKSAQIVCDHYSHRVCRRSHFQKTL